MVKVIRAGGANTPAAALARHHSLFPARNEKVSRRSEGRDSHMSLVSEAEQTHRSRQRAALFSPFIACPAAKGGSNSSIFLMSAKF